MSRARLTRKNSPLPPSFARGACSFGKCARRILEVTLCSFGKCARRILEVTLGKSAILPRFIKLYSMCPQHRNVCEAPLCGCMSKHFTRSFVAQRIKSAFHVFAKAKTFHFCAEDTLAYCSLLSAQKFHVLRKGIRFRTLFIVPLRRTSGCSVTLLHFTFRQKERWSVMFRI